LELKNQKKARLTTLAIIPPNEVWPEIQKIRSQHDRQVKKKQNLSFFLIII